MSDYIEAMMSREHYLLQEINVQLEMWGAKARPLKAADMIATIHSDKLAEIMAWAQIALRGVVTEQHLAMQMRNVTATTALLAAQPSNNTGDEK